MTKYLIVAHVAISTGIIYMNAIYTLDGPLNAEFISDVRKELAQNATIPPGAVMLPPYRAIILNIIKLDE